MKDYKSSIEFFENVLNFWQIQETQYRKHWEKTKDPDFYMIWGHCNSRCKKYRRIIENQKRLKGELPDLFCSKELMGLYQDLTESQKQKLELQVLEKLAEFGILPYKSFQPIEEDSFSFFAFYHRAVLKTLLDKQEIKEMFVDGIRCFSRNRK